MSLLQYAFSGHAHAESSQSVNVVAASGVAEVLPADPALHDVTLTADCTITLTAPSAGAHVATVVLRQDGVGGHAVTWSTEVLWPHDVVPDFDTAPGVVEVVTLLTVDQGVTWFASRAGAP